MRASFPNSKTGFYLRVVGLALLVSFTKTNNGEKKVNCMEGNYSLGLDAIGTINFQLAPSLTNCHIITDVQSVNDLNLNQKWFVYVFTGWYADHVVGLNSVLELSKMYPQISFAVKCLTNTTSLRLSKFYKGLDDNIIPVYMQADIQSISVLSQGRHARREDVVKTLNDWIE